MQTERVLSSGIFRDSPIQQRLLRYLVDQSLAGSSAHLKEYTIGAAVFGRRDDFDPRTDSIVRVQVGVLRKKLAAYYAGPGAGDEYVVEVPRGHYAPQFTARNRNPVAAIPEVHLRPVWIYVLAGILAGGLAVFVVDRLLVPTPPSNSTRASEWRKHPLWKGFFEPGLPVKLVIGAPFLLDFNGLLVRDSGVNTPEGIAGSAAVKYLSPLTHVKPVPVEVYTGMGEAEGASLLTRFFDHAGVDLPLIRSRLTKWQDL
ncbi:MAG: hypothetical protein ABIZ80_08850, partial [Bryobacteraceae bacterium]